MALAALRNRRTIRQYDKSYVIPDQVLEQIVDAALLSPTACNSQDIDLVVCTNKDLLDRITTTVMANWEPSLRSNFMSRTSEYGVTNVLTCDAPCVIFLVKNERSDPAFTQIDAGIVSMSLMVAAKEFGLDTMCLGAILWGKPEEVEALLKIEKGHLVMAVALGSARINPKVAPKNVICKARWIK